MLNRFKSPQIPWKRVFNYVARVSGAGLGYFLKKMGAGTTALYIKHSTQPPTQNERKFFSDFHTKSLNQEKSQATGSQG